jgi:N-carbamoylputrescine amidase
MGAEQRAGTLTVGLVQQRCGDDHEDNFTRAVAGVEEAAARGASLVCLQELFRTPYFCQREDASIFDLAEAIPGESTARLGEVAARLGVAIVASLFERRAPGIYHNTAVTLDTSGAIVSRYRKLHIPDDPLYYEKFYFTPGDLGVPVASVAAVPVATLVCWDQWFPEAARLAALGGASVLTYPTAIGWQFDEGPEVDAAQRDAWETIQRSHAIANGVFVVSTNRVGREGEIRFWGSSFVADPFGRVLARASDSEEEVLVVTCDLDKVESVRRDWPFLRDRRLDAYADLTRRFRD